MKRLKISWPRTREDWTFYFQLIGFIGNLFFCAWFLSNWFDSQSKPKQENIILIDSAWAAEHLPMLYDNRDKSK